MIRNQSITRLSRYNKALVRLKSMGFVKVFSDNLADATGVTPAQVRKDFSLFGISGNKKGGYLIEDLVVRISEILGKNREQKVIIAGLGNLGSALLRYRNFQKEGIRIVGGFDINPSRLKTAGEIPLMPLEEMGPFVKSNEVRIGIIAVPDTAAQQVLDNMIQAGIKGVMNFAPIRLHAPEGFIIRNVNLEMELELVNYYVNAQERSPVIGDWEDEE